MTKRQNVLVRKVLAKAIGILDNKKHWTKRFLARDAAGKPVDAQSSKATCFCAAGAIWAASTDVKGAGARIARLSIEAAGDAAPIKGPGGRDALYCYNDRVVRGPGQIRALFRRTIKDLEKEAAGE